MRPDPRFLPDPDDGLGIPVLRTRRLRMRGWREADLDGFAALTANPVAAAQMGGSVFSRAQAWRALAGMIGHWVLRGYGRWVVTCASSERFIGVVGLLRPEAWPGIELAWSIRQPDWGQGYATEAARAALDWAHAALALTSVMHLIAPHNQASIRVAEKLGAQLESERCFDGEPVLVYRSACRPA